MDRWNRLSRVALERLVRCLWASAALFLCSFGSYLQLQADIGLSPWFSLNQGIANVSPLTYGQASILVAFLVIALDLLLREPIGIGTILTSLIMGLGVDLYNALDLVPIQTTLPLQLLTLLAGIAVASAGTAFYMMPALSCGPRDALLVALGRRVSRLTIGQMELLLSVAVQIAACLMGGPFGVGTFITVFSTSFMLDAVFHLLRFEPRNLTHEGFSQTFAAFRDAWRTPV